MNMQVEKLGLIASKKERLIVGLMSGTSVDGLDIALCRFSAQGLETKAELLNYTTRPYSQEIQQTIRQVFAKADARLEWVCILNDWLGIVHAEMIIKQLKEWNIASADVDLIASHGQTIYHAAFQQHKKPGFPNSTLQIADGDHIAQGCGIITLSDFRQKHLAAGGEGAPLAVYGDYLLFGNAKKKRFLLNIGGISNFTMLPAADSDELVFSSDAGPGNTLSDAFIRKRISGKEMDENGELAQKGICSPELLTILNQNAFFSKPFPKSTGPEDFSLDFLGDALSQISDQLSNNDVLATLAQFTADSLFKGLVDNGAGPEAELFVSGGGIYNQAIMDNLKSKAPFMQHLRFTDDLGIKSDAKEAVLFACLANEAVAGNMNLFKDKFANGIAVSMGKISFPG